jgi:hypothetical protein
MALLGGLLRSNSSCHVLLDQIIQLRLGHADVATTPITSTAIPATNSTTNATTTTSCHLLSRSKTRHQIPEQITRNHEEIISKKVNQRSGFHHGY